MKEANRSSLSNREDQSIGTELWASELGNTQGEWQRERERVLSHVTEQHVSVGSVNSLPLSLLLSLSFLPLRYKRCSQPIRMQRFCITLPVSLSLSFSVWLCRSLCECVTHQHILSLSLIQLSLSLNVTFRINFTDQIPLQFKNTPYPRIIFFHSFWEYHSSYTHTHILYQFPKI